MQPKLLIFGFLYLVLEKSDATNKCYRAKICIHDGKEKCGQDMEGKVRRFLDSCDVKEYNCLKHTDYVKTDPSKCRQLPPINKEPLTKDNDKDHEGSSSETLTLNLGGDNIEGANNMEIAKMETDNKPVSSEGENDAKNNKDSGDRISKEKEKYQENEENQVNKAVNRISGEDGANIVEETEKIAKKDEKQESSKKSCKKTSELEKTDEDNTEGQVDEVNKENKFEEGGGKSEEDEISKNIKADGIGKSDNENEAVEEQYTNKKSRH